MRFLKHTVTVGKQHMLDKQLARAQAAYDAEANMGEHEKSHSAPVAQPSPHRRPLQQQQQAAPAQEQKPLQRRHRHESCQPGPTGNACRARELKSMQQQFLSLSAAQRNKMLRAMSPHERQLFLQT